MGIFRALWCWWCKPRLSLQQLNVAITAGEVGELHGAIITMGPGAKIWRGADGSLNFKAGDGDEGGGDLIISGNGARM